MKALFRIEQGLLKQIHSDLSRPHAFAHERVGFIACRVANIEDGFSILAERYVPVEDGDYEDGHGVGAMMGAAAIRKALQIAYNERVSMIHVHRHEHRGVPRFSAVDLTESAKFVPDFWKVRPELPHGMVVLSRDSMAGMAWNPADKKRVPMHEMTAVGRPTGIWRACYDKLSEAAKFSRP